MFFDLPLPIGNGHILDWIDTCLKSVMADGVITDQFVMIFGMETLVFTFELLFVETATTEGATESVEGFTSGGRCLSAPTTDEE